MFMHRSPCPGLPCISLDSVLSAQASGTCEVQTEQHWHPCRLHPDQELLPQLAYGMVTAGCRTQQCLPAPGSAKQGAML